MRRFKNEEEALAFIDTLPWGTAAGTTKDPRMAVKYAQAGAKIVHFGSVTWSSRAGNPGDNFYYDPRTGNSINAWGIPNRGIHAYLPELVDLRPEIESHGAQLWVSISAGDTFVPEEYREMTQMLFEYKAAHVVAANKSCPNIEVGGKRKPVVCFDLDAYERGVTAVSKGADGKPFAIKIAPITEFSILSDLVNIAVNRGASFIEGANSVGNCYIEKPDGTPAISMGRGGGAGKMLSPIVDGMSRMVKPMLEGTQTKFLAVGGVQEGFDAYQRLKNGADGFEFNTILSAFGGRPEVITNLIMGEIHCRGLAEILVERGL